MIKELRLQNWKSFADATLFIDPLTVLIGSNASGKSNALDALLFLHRISQGVALFPAIAGDVNLPALRGGIEWVCRKPENQFTLGLFLGSATSKQDYLYEISVAVNGAKAEIASERLVLLPQNSRSHHTPREKVLYQTEEVTTMMPGMPVYFWTGTQGRGKRLDLNRGHCILSQVETLNLRKEVLDGAREVRTRLQKIFILDPVPGHMRDYTALSEQLLSDGSNIAGVLAGLEGNRKTEVEQTLTHYLRALPERDIKRIWTEPVGKFKTDAMLYCEESWEKDLTHEIDARGMSDGALRFLAIVTALLTREPGSLLVVEEVDNGLHPSRAHLLINMLHTLGNERHIDVVVTTHNPALLDAAGIGMLPFITVAHRDTTTGHSILTLLEDIERLPKLMAGGSLGRLTSEGRIESALNEDVTS